MANRYPRSGQPPTQSVADFERGCHGHGLAPGYQYGYYGPAYTWAYYSGIFGVPPDAGYGPSNWFGPNIDEYAAVVPPGGYRALAGHYPPWQPRRARRADQRIRACVLANFHANPDLDSTHIEVGVEAGVVVLSGYVRNRAEKRRAEDDADAVPGVRDVDNRLTFPKN